MDSQYLKDLNLGCSQHKICGASHQKDPLRKIYKKIDWYRKTHCVKLFCLALLLAVSSNSLANTHSCLDSIVPKKVWQKFKAIGEYACDINARKDSELIKTLKKHEAIQLSLYSSSKKTFIPSEECETAEGKCKKNTYDALDIHSLGGEFSHFIDSFSHTFNIDPLLLHAIAYVESRYDPKATSPKGARGIMQIMPTMAERFGFQGSVNQLYNPAVNIRLSCVYLRKLYDIFGNDIPLVLAAYNAGENAVIKYGRRIPPYVETQKYVKKVVNRYLELRSY